MPFQLILIASFLAIASCDLGAPTAFGHNVGYGFASPAGFGYNVGYGSASPAAFGYNVAYRSASPAAPNVHVIPALPPTFVQDAAPKTDPNPKESVKKETDPALVAAHDAHKAFEEKQNVTPPYHYSYGYELYNWKTSLTQSQYESRYGGVAYGTLIRQPSEGNRSIVDYTVDARYGFYGILRKNVEIPRTTLGYASLAAPLAYASHPPLEEYNSRTTILADPGSIEDPRIQSLVRTHLICISYFDLSAPFNHSWGYEIKDSKTGISRSQYETYFGENGEGRYSQIEVDGTRTSIDYSVSPKGIAVTLPETLKLKANPFVQAPAWVIIP